MGRKFKEWFSVQLVKHPGRMVLGVIQVELVELLITVQITYIKVNIVHITI